MKYKKVILMLLILLALGCFYVVYLMYSKLSFIDTPYLYGGLFFLVLAVFLSLKK
ncbi:MAG: hypothetical protein VW058_05480 [Flavobacteriaceae bacterium]|jgi:hypothetical protein